jgi:ATP-dependent RNA helicase DDX52/ROK1
LQPKTSSTKGKGKALDHEGELPPELDFFKYAAQHGSLSKRKAEDGKEKASRKKRRLSEDVSDEESNVSDEVVVGKAKPKPVRHRVATKGDNVPEPVSLFSELKERFTLPGRLLANLPSSYDYPTGVQAYAIPILLSGRDLAAISPTGTGKTVAYLLPLFASLGAPVSSAEKEKAGEQGPKALILAPTKELAGQIHNECLKLAQGRKWRLVLFSKATSATMKDKNVRSKVGELLVA